MNFTDRIKSYCNVLNVQCEAPYQICSNDEWLEFDAYLPHFGSERGQLVMKTFAPDFSVSSIHVNFAKELGIPISFLNPESVMTIEEFIDALRDWGCFGIEEVPAFLRG
jgi:hypothetical protein